MPSLIVFVVKCGLIWWLRPRFAHYCRWNSFDISCQAQIDTVSYMYVLIKCAPCRKNHKDTSVWPLYASMNDVSCVQLLILRSNTRSITCFSIIMVRMILTTIKGQFSALFCLRRFWLWRVLSNCALRSAAVIEMSNSHISGLILARLRVVHNSVYTSRSWIPDWLQQDLILSVSWGWKQTFAIQKPNAWS